VQQLWDSMVGIPTPPKRGCGRLSYVGLSCSYARHRKALIPCARVLGIIHAKDTHNHSIYDLDLAIFLGVEGHGFGELGVQ
jgi:hypothetical protein